MVRLKSKLKNYSGLVLALDDRDPWVRWAAAKALEKLSGKSVDFNWFDKSEKKRATHIKKWNEALGKK